MTCHSNRMDVRLEFDEPFDGIVFADQAYNDSVCRWEGQHEATAEVTVMLIISPVKNILVNGVTSLQIRCLYDISDITITMANLQLVSVTSSLI
ncbi:unnamed protein product [Onchocerca ochengi]|uniref:ZP domain-containing protein n=1 Tax=Onchocerca ochengi TaxID=42157 RepID=A0A182E2E8_ONCOC|nr:unnamed protein product [Onchocerca ochengi]